MPETEPEVTPEVEASEKNAKTAGKEEQHGDSKKHKRVLSSVGVVDHFDLEPITITLPIGVAAYVYTQLTEKLDEVAPMLAVAKLLNTNAFAEGYLDVTGTAVIVAAIHDAIRSTLEEPCCPEPHLSDAVAQYSDAIEGYKEYAREKEMDEARKAKRNRSSLDPSAIATSLLIRQLLRDIGQR